MFAAMAALGGCAGRKSAAGFHLPDGDPARGQAVFVDMRCHTCHRVHGLDLPAPVAEPSVEVVLGGEVYAERTDGELVAAIVDPSHRLAPGYRAATVKSGSLSRMPDYGDALSVRDMIDLVAFLHTRYKLLPPPSGH
jgi:mono/diheme cytochrome c family protein